MSPNILSSEYPHLNRMMEIERELGVMSVFKIFNVKYWKLKAEYRELQRIGFQLGFMIGIKDLVDAGILKKIK